MASIGTIDGVAVLALQMAMIDITDWLELMRKKYYRSRVKTEPKVERKGGYRGLAIEKIERVGLDSSPMGDFSRCYRVSAPSPRTELDFINEVNRRIYGLVSSLTSRELEVIRKRVIEQKSLKQTASEMAISAQGVVAFMRSIRGKVKRFLLD